MTEQRKLQIESRLHSVRSRIAEAANRVGRKPDEIELVAITKGYPTEFIHSAYHLGLRHFGENRVEEALPKLDAMIDLEDMVWHMVGYVQSRKAKAVAPRFDWVHSVDRLKLARRLDRFAGEAGRRLPVLLECNVSGEQSKAGWVLWEQDQWSQILPLFSEVLAMEHLEVRGLMTMAPWTSDKDHVRDVFQSLRELRNFLEAHLPGNWHELSMGMSSDFEIAIEEGATLVRIGQAIFGPRAGDVCAPDQVES
ncbi:MAG TPA: YggS family pyridoxal phosphate-dependent enzyme [Anaerolineae bacterium]|nr:YggS family pyridoxal phosphate-dependent enzyme [Anaerolineae bacterium]